MHLFYLSSSTKYSSVYFNTITIILWQLYWHVGKHNLGGNKTVLGVQCDWTKL